MCGGQSVVENSSCDHGFCLFRRSFSGFEHRSTFVEMCIKRFNDKLMTREGINLNRALHPYRCCFLQLFRESSSHGTLDIWQGIEYTHVYLYANINT